MCHIGKAYGLDFVILFSFHTVSQWGELVFSQMSICYDSSSVEIPRRGVIPL